MLILLFCSLLWGAPKSVPPQDQTLEIVTPEKRVAFSLREMKSKLKSQTITVDDPVYKKPKQYDVFLLKDVFILAGVDPAKMGDEVVFTAVDGYSPNTTFEKLRAHTAYLAYQDHATPGRFALVSQGRSTISPWPFYVIWSEGRALKDEVPWPYQLVKIEVVDLARKYPNIVPRGAGADAPESKGFALFKSRCIRCHAVNGQGGELGPELNIPKNITEYWRPETLKAFIHNVASFRAKSKMPVFDDLKDSEIDDLLAYLKAMKELKVKSSP